MPWTAEPVRLRSASEQIPHQNVGVDDKAVALLIVAEHFEIPDAVGSGAKNILALVTTSDHVVERTSEVNSRLSRHRIPNTTVTPS